MIRKIYKYRKQYKLWLNKLKRLFNPIKKVKPRPKRAEVPKMARSVEEYLRIGVNPYSRWSPEKCKAVIRAGFNPTLSVGDMLNFLFERAAIVVEKEAVVVAPAGLFVQTPAQQMYTPVPAQVVTDSTPALDEKDTINVGKAIEALKAGKWSEQLISSALMSKGYDAAKAGQILGIAKARLTPVVAAPVQPQFVMPF